MDGERRGDWENGVNNNLVSLNTAQRVADKLLRELERKQAAIDKLLRGDAERDIDGLIARMHALENLVNELRSGLRALGNTVGGDHAGGLGHEQRIGQLEGKRQTKEKREGYFWAFVTATVSGVLLVGALMMLNWDRVEAFGVNVWSHVHHEKPAAAPAKIKRKTRAKKKKELPPIVMPELQGAGESSGEAVR